MNCYNVALLWFLYYVTLLTVLKILFVINPQKKYNCLLATLIYHKTQQEDWKRNSLGISEQINYLNAGVSSMAGFSPHSIHDGTASLL